ncbi:hypothetical protein D3C75_1047090 [compost metagenome]
MQLTFNSQLIDSGDGILLGEQNNGVLFTLVAFQRTGEIQAYQIAVINFNIQPLPDLVNQPDAEIKRHWPRCLQVVHGPLTALL